MEILAAVGMKNFVFPHLFSIPFIMSALLCAATAGMSPPISGRWAGVGRSCKHPYYKFAPTQAPSVTLRPPEPSYLTDILDLHWGYLGRILTISLLYILGLSHFLNTFNTLSELVHHSCKTPPKQYCEVISIHAYTPSLHLCTIIPPPPLRHYIGLTIIIASLS